YRSADLRALRYAVTDAETFAAAIGPEMRFQPKALLPKNGEATREPILKEISRITQIAKPDDAVLIFFAGHGLARGERYYLMPNDTEWRRPGADGKRKNSSDQATVDFIGTEILMHSESPRRRGRGEF